MGGNMSLKKSILTYSLVLLIYYVALYSGVLLFGVGISTILSNPSNLAVIPMATFISMTPVALLFGMPVFYMMLGLAFVSFVVFWLLKRIWLIWLVVWFAIGVDFYIKMLHVVSIPCIGPAWSCSAQLWNGSLLIAYMVASVGAIWLILGRIGRQKLIYLIGLSVFLVILGWIGYQDISAHDASLKVPQGIVEGNLNR